MVHNRMVGVYCWEVNTDAMSLQIEGNEELCSLKSKLVCHANVVRVISCEGVGLVALPIR